MNRDQKAAAIAEIAAQIEESDAVFAVDYRGITVSQAVELRGKLRDADAAFRIVKNSLTERAADQVGADELKPFLQGPTALTFVRGDVASAAKAIADYGRRGDILAFKGGVLNGKTIDGEQIKAIARLPSRQVLYGQLVGMVAQPITGLARTLNALIQGLAIQLGQVQELKESGQIPSGTATAAAPAAVEEEAPAAQAPAAEAPAAEPAAEEQPETENVNQADASAESDGAEVQEEEQA
jgi:large subunit ribosomal protein L10